MGLLSAAERAELEALGLAPPSTQQMPDAPAASPATATLLTQGLDVSVKDDHIGDDGFTPQEWFPILLYALKGPEFGAYLVGDFATGKDTSINKACAICDRKLFTFQCSASTTEHDLLGYRDLDGGSSTYTPGPLTRALMWNEGRGAALHIVEANIAHPGMLAKLHTCTDGSESDIVLPDGTILPPPGPDFRVLLSYNDGGVHYAGTRDVNPALLSRLVPIRTPDLSPSIKERAIVAKTGCTPNCAKQVVALGRAIQDACRKQGLAHHLSLREQVRMVNMRATGTWSWEEVFKICVLDPMGGAESGLEDHKEAIVQAARVIGIEKW